MGINQNLPNTMKDKDMEEVKEKIMKILGLPRSTLLPGGHDPWEITTHAGCTLIPRIMVTDIVVYAISTDIWMDSRRHHTNNNNNNNNIQHGIRANYMASDMDLHTAASHGSINMACEVVSRKRDLLWCGDSQRNLPLHLAVENGHKEVAIYLVREYPQASYALNISNISPFYLAVVHHPKDLDLVGTMFGELVRDDHVVDGLTRGKSIVRAAIEDNNQDMLKTILNYQPGLIKSTDEEGFTPLSYAALKGYVESVCYMFKKFPKSIYYLNQDKSFPIHKACLGGHVDILRMFHSKHPKSLLSGDQHGQNVLHLAAKERGNKLKRVVSYLMSLREGKELAKKKDENDFTPLELAKKSRNHEVELVIERGMLA